MGGVPYYLYGADKHPVGRKAWSTYREAFFYWKNWTLPTECDFCKGPLSTFEHEEIWDYLRLQVFSDGRRGYAPVPAWFPVNVCPTCAEYLTPFLGIIADIALLRSYEVKLEGVINDVKNPKRYRTAFHWSAPVSARECRDICDKWIAGD